MIDLKQAMRNEVIKYTNGVPGAIIDAAAVDGLRRFLSDSLVWEEQQKLDAYAESVIAFPNDMERTSITQVIEAETELGRRVPVRWYGGKVHFDRIHNDTITVRFALVNNKLADKASIPNWLYTQHIDALTHIVVRLLKEQQFKPWFDPEGAAYHDHEYRKGLAEALMDKTPKKVNLMNFTLSKHWIS